MTIKQRLIYTNAEGRASIVTPAPQWFESMIQPEILAVEGVDGVEEVLAQPEVPAVYEQQEVEITPAVFDDDGLEITPAVTEMQDVLISEAIPAVEYVAPVEYVAEVEYQPEVTAEDCWAIILEKEKKNHAINIVIKQKLDEGMTREEVAAYIKENHATILPVEIPDIERVSETKIPTDKTFRNAWRKKTGGLKCDITAAKEIAKENIREVRKDKFIELDTESLIAQEKADAVKLKKIKEKKEMLRDVTDDERLNKTTEAELKASMLTIIDEVKATTV